MYDIRACFMKEDVREYEKIDKNKVKYVDLYLDMTLLDNKKTLAMFEKIIYKYDYILGGSYQLLIGNYTIDLFATKDNLEKIYSGDLPDTIILSNGIIEKCDLLTKAGWCGDRIELNIFAEEYNVSYKYIDGEVFIYATPENAKAFYDKCMNKCLVKANYYLNNNNLNDANSLIYRVISIMDIAQAKHPYAVNEEKLNDIHKLYDMLIELMDKS